MQTLTIPQTLPGPGKPCPMMWKLVPQIIRTTLVAENCHLIPHWQRRLHEVHVRFQYAPFVYQGDLFYLQRWAPAEWGVAPSQVIFHRQGWPCSVQTLRNGSYLSLKVRQAVTELVFEDGPTMETHFHCKAQRKL